MCLGCGFTDHQGNIQYARNSENSPQMMVPPREYLSRSYSFSRESRNSYN